MDKIYFSDCHIHTYWLSFLHFLSLSHFLHVIMRISCLFCAYLDSSTALFGLSGNVRKALDPLDTCIYFLWGCIFLSLIFSVKSYDFTLRLQAQIVFVFSFTFKVVLFFLSFLVNTAQNSFSFPRNVKTILVSNL